VSNFKHVFYFEKVKKITLKLLNKQHFLFSKINWLNAKMHHEIGHVNKPKGVKSNGYKFAQSAELKDVEHSLIHIMKLKNVEHSLIHIIKP
jgi:hypothetical protein